MKGQDFTWKPDPTWHYAQRIRKDGFELVAYDIPEGAGGDTRLIGWELFTGRRFADLVDKGDAPDLAAARAAAEQAYRHYRGALS